MVNPQLENGYIRIATELFDFLTKTRIPGEAMQCLNFIIRKTYGWNKKEDQIALSQFVLNTGIDRSNVIRAIKKLIEINIIIVKKDTYGPNTYKINKDCSSWKPLSKKTRGVSNKNKGGVKKDNCGESKKTHTKDTSTTNTITIDTKDKFDHFWDVYPKRKAKKEAFKAFIKLKPDETLFTKILNSIKFQSESKDWRKENGQYIPNPATWLNQERWNDEVVVIEEDPEQGLNVTQRAVLESRRRREAQEEEQKQLGGVE